MALADVQEIILEKNYHGERIDILSDSQAALQAISSVEIKSTMVLGCIRMLNRAATKNYILLAWIPEHRGNNGNYVDELGAKEAAATSPIGPEPFLVVGPTIYERSYGKRKGPVENATRNKCLGFDRRGCSWES